jgi:hypothetical protein
VLQISINVCMPLLQASCNDIMLLTVVIKHEGKEDNAAIITRRVELANSLEVKTRRLLPEYR